MIFGPRKMGSDATEMRGGYLESDEPGESICV